MASVTLSILSIDQLKAIASSPEQTHAQIEAVLFSLAADGEVCQWACEALENCDAPPVSTVDCITRLVAHEDPLVASWSCKLLARIGRDAIAAEQALVNALSARSQELVREEAARALGLIGATSSSARAALTSAAQNGGPRLQRLATAYLGG